MKKTIITNRLFIALFLLSYYPSHAMQQNIPQTIGQVVSKHRIQSYIDPKKIAADQAMADTTNLLIKPTLPLNADQAREQEPTESLLLPIKHNFILERFFESNETEHQPNYLPQLTWSDTNLLAEHQGIMPVFNRIDKTITPFGSSMLTKWLLLPQSISKLKQQQNVMRFLNTRQEVSTLLNENLISIKQHEHAYFNFLQSDQLTEAHINNMYYYKQGGWGNWLGLSSLDSSVLGQNAFQASKRLRTAGYTAAALGTAYLAYKQAENVLTNPLQSLVTSDNASKLGLTLLAGGYLMAPATHKSIQKNMLHQKVSQALSSAKTPAEEDQILATATTMLNFIEKTNNTSIYKNPEGETVHLPLLNLKDGIITNAYNIKDNFNNLSTPKKIEAFGAGMQASEDLVEHLGNVLDNSYKRAKNIPFNIINRETTNTSLVTYMHSQLIDMGHIARQLEAINTIFTNRPGFAKNLTYSKYIQGLFDANSTDVSNDLRSLMEMLLTNTFTGTPSWFSNQGRVIAAYKLMRDTKLEWLHLFEAVGELDAYLSCAKLYQESQQTDQKIVFVDYPKNVHLHNGFAHPEVIITGLWNMVHPDMPTIEKTISLGVTPHNSTTVANLQTLQATAVALIIGSTLGIAPADHMKLIPFDNINTLIMALKHPQAAMQQIEEIFDIAQHQATTSLQAVIIDGTNPDKNGTIDSIIEMLKPITNTAIVVAK